MLDRVLLDFNLFVLGFHQTLRFWSRFKLLMLIFLILEKAGSKSFDFMFIGAALNF